MHPTAPAQFPSQYLLLFHSGHQILASFHAVVQARGATSCASWPCLGGGACELGMEPGIAEHPSGPPPLPLDHPTLPFEGSLTNPYLPPKLSSQIILGILEFFSKTVLRQAVRQARHSPENKK